MVCPSCGARYPDCDAACGYCGIENKSYKPQKNSNLSDIGGDSVKPVNPWDAFPGAVPYKDPESPQEQPAWQQSGEEEFARRRAKSVATISLIFGILGNIFAGPIFGPIAIFSGLRAKKLGYTGFRASAGLAFGAFAIIFWIFALVSIFYLIPEYFPEMQPMLEPFFFS